MPIGAICYWGKTTPPAGWLLCDGSAVSQATYPALFALLGTTFGPAAGGNFTLPDLRSRIPIGTGTGAGLSAYALAATGGEETHTLVSGEMPSHTHAQDVNTVIGAGAALPVQASLSPNHALGGTTSSTGGGGSHNNIQPYLVLTAIIRAL
jgi:microcystin-dependent protein